MASGRYTCGGTHIRVVPLQNSRHHLTHRLAILKPNVELPGVMFPSDDDGLPAKICLHLDHIAHLNISMPAGGRWLC